MKPTYVSDVAELRAALSIPEGAPVAICLSPMVPTARHVSLVRAWRLIADIWPGATLLLTGDGPVRATIDALVERLQLGEEVRVLGDRDDIAALLDLADFHIVPAESAGVAASITAASLAAKPTVAPDDWSCRAFVKDGQTGALFTPADEHAMAAAIASLIQDPFVAEKMGRAAREEWEQRAGDAAVNDAGSHA